jgi:hypothetical protein
MPMRNLNLQKRRKSEISLAYSLKLIQHPLLIYFPDETSYSSSVYLTPSSLFLPQPDDLIVLLPLEVWKDEIFW